MAYDTCAVANALLEIGKRKGVQMSMMKLIKMTFFAHAWSLAIFGRPLCSETVQAWRYGPVFPYLYNTLAGAGYKGAQIINKPLPAMFSDEPAMANFEPAERQLMEKVVDRYGQYSSFDLSRITHIPGSPWSQVSPEGLFVPIPDSVIRDYYVRKARSNQKSRGESGA